jgi:hypothetical protein
MLRIRLGGIKPQFGRRPAGALVEFANQGPPFNFLRVAHHTKPSSQNRSTRQNLKPTTWLKNENRNRNSPCETTLTEMGRQSNLVGKTT